jgi:hypothetical protein
MVPMVHCTSGTVDNPLSTTTPPHPSAHAARAQTHAAEGGSGATSASKSPSPLQNNKARLREPQLPKAGAVDAVALMRRRATYEYSGDLKRDP